MQTIDQDHNQNFFYLAVLIILLHLPPAPYYLSPLPVRFPASVCFFIPFFVLVFNVCSPLMYLPLFPVPGIISVFSAVCFLTMLLCLLSPLSHTLCLCISLFLPPSFPPALPPLPSSNP